MHLYSGRHRSGRHRASWLWRGGPRVRRARLAALTGFAAATVALPLAVASAGPIGDAGLAVARMSGLADDKASTDGGKRDGLLHDGTHDRRTGDDGERAGETGVPAEAAGDEAPGASRSPLSLGIGLATATRCGPELSSPDGIEAQTCVLTQGEETWARTYYRNATGEELSSVLSLMAPDGRAVRMHCAVGAQDEPGVCETPREHARGDLRAYTAIAEFAGSTARGPLLLRSGSNSSAHQRG